MILDPRQLSVSSSKFLSKVLVLQIIAAGLGSAYRTLDSIRAIKQSGHITGISSNPLITMSGYSSAATVTAWVSQTKPSHHDDNY
jgi:hypothetical protein